MATNESSLQHHPTKDHGIPPDTVPAMAFGILILMINSCVVLLITSYANLRTTSNIILGSLAVSDLLVGLIGIPLLVVCSSTFSSPVCVSSSTFFTFTSMSTVLHITVVTCDRFIYIMWALRYDEIVRHGRVLTALCLTWFISLTSLVRLSWTLNVNIITAKEDLGLVQEKETIYWLFNFIAFFFIPLVVMVALDARMLLLLRRQCQRIARENLPAAFMKREKRMQNRQRRAVITCVLLLILYVIFWLPFFILELSQHHFGDQFGVPKEVNVTIYYLRLFTSLFNPLIYTLRKHDLKKAARGIYGRVFPCHREDVLRKSLTEQTPLSCPTYV
ncbi:histamine H2 receptor-like [Montipora capricornis]|uniref:histamine H2 receptor-like n=1 Tax=Montipora capricornis TaxID=246305 RepID=UPI0035F1B8EA